jgi:hypothetical protein
MGRCSYCVLPELLREQNPFPWSYLTSSWFRRNPQVRLQLAATAFVKADSFGLKHPLLLVEWENDAAGGTCALRINYPVPRGLIVAPVHYKSDGSRRVAFSQNLRKLSIGHNTSARNPANDLVNTFPVILVGFSCHAITSGFEEWPAPEHHRRYRRRSSTEDKSVHMNQHQRLANPGLLK